MCLLISSSARTLPRDYIYLHVRLRNVFFISGVHITKPKIMGYNAVEEGEETLEAISGLCHKDVSEGVTVDKQDKL